MFRLSDFELASNDRIDQTDLDTIWDDTFLSRSPNPLPSSLESLQVVLQGSDLDLNNNTNDPIQQMSDLDQDVGGQPISEPSQLDVLLSEPASVSLFIDATGFICPIDVSINYSLICDVSQVSTGIGK
jgi:hypothetical protein